MAYLPRIVDAEPAESLEDLPAVAIEGAKGIGKTSTATQPAESSMRLDRSAPDHPSQGDGDVVGSIRLDAEPAPADLVRRAPRQLFAWPPRSFPPARTNALPGAPSGAAGCAARVTANGRDGIGVLRERRRREAVDASGSGSPAARAGLRGAGTDDRGGNAGCPRRPWPTGTPSVGTLR